MRATRVAGLGALATAVLVAGAGPASAASGKIEQITSEEGQVAVVFSAVDAPSGAGIDAASVKMTINSSTVPAQAEPLSQTDVSRTSALVIDTSGSMRGPGIDGAKAAALEYLAVVPDDVEVALVTFNDGASVAMEPTTDRTALEQAVSGLTAGGETALYDAVLLGVKTVGGADVGNVVVLSDGGDTVSEATLNSAIAAVDESSATVDAVAFATDESVTGALQQITEAGNGAVVSANGTGDVAAAFADQANQVASQVLVTAAVPEGLDGSSGRVEVTGTVAGEAVSDRAYIILSGSTAVAGATASTAAAGLLGSSVFLAIALIAVFWGLFVVVWFAGRRSAARSTEAPRLKKRLSVYSISGGRSGSEAAVRVEEQSTVLGTSAVARNVVEYAGKMAEKHQFDSSLAQRLEAANLKLRPGEWVVLHLAIAVTTTVVFLLLGSGGGVSGLLLWGLIGAGAGFAGPYLYLKYKESKRLRAFEEALPDTLQLVAGGLSAGHSFPQAIDGVVRQGVEPVAGEFGRALAQSRLGMPLEDTLEEVANRMQSRDFAWVVMAIRIQRQVGGNLSEVLLQVADTLRERAYLKRQVKSLSAEGRLSAYILFAVPILFALYLQITRPEYLKPLYNTNGGLVAIVVMITLMIVGAIWMSRIVKLEV